MPNCFQFLTGKNVPVTPVRNWKQFGMRCTCMAYAPPKTLDSDPRP